MPDKYDGNHVKVVLPNGSPVEIAFNESLFDDYTEKLLLSRHLRDGIICRGKFDWKLKRVVQWVSDGKPVILDVREATTESLIEALEMDQFEIKIKTLEQAYQLDIHEVLKRRHSTTPYPQSALELPPQENS